MGKINASLPGSSFWVITQRFSPLYEGRVYDLCAAAPSLPEKFGEGAAEHGVGTPRLEKERCVTTQKQLRGRLTKYPNESKMSPLRKERWLRKAQDGNFNLYLAYSWGYGEEYHVTIS